MNMLEAALAYPAAGLAIFPCHWPIFTGGCVQCSCGDPVCGPHIGKHPRTREGHKDATDNPDRIAAYWSRCPDANIGLATGARNGITVLDVDPRNGGDRSLERLEEQYGPLPLTRRARSGSGGWHIYFQYLPDVRNSASEIGAGLDIKGDGGLVIAPPSLHFSGGRYEWLNDAPPAEAPAWLTAKLRTPESRGAAPPERWRALFAEGATKGQRDTTLIRMTGYLLRRRLDPLLVLDIMQMWNRERFRPPLTETEVTRDVASICHAELRKRGD
jgi:hypothetical protein